MRRVFIFSFCLLALLFTQCKNSDKAVIGVDLPLTGAYEYWGNEFKSGAEIYCNMNPNVRVIFEDNQGIPDNAVMIANKLINIDMVDAFVSLFAPFSFNLRDKAENAKIPFISSFNSSTTFAEGYDYCFTDFATHDMQLPLLVDCVTDSLNLSNGLYYCVNDDYGTDGAKIISQLMDAKGISISGELFNAGTADHRNSLAKIMNDDMDFIFLIARNRDLINAVNQIRERNKDILILGAGSFDAPEIWDGIPVENQKNIIFASSYFDKDYNDESMNFYNAFYELRDREPNYPAVFGYTICQYLAEGLAKAREQNVSLASILGNLDYDSIRGLIKMTDNHIIYSSIAIYQRADGHSVPIAVKMDM